MNGIILYLLTTAFFPIWFFVLFFILVLFLQKDRYRTTLRDNKAFLGQIKLFMTLSCINFIIHSLVYQEFEVPQFIFIPMIVYIAFSLSKKDINYIIPFICIEGVFGLLEYSSGVVTFFSQSLQSSEDAFMADEDLLYFKRVAGLSVGPSSYGLKLLVGIVLCDLSSYSKKWIKHVLQLFLLVCLVMSFHRTSLLAIAIYLLWKYFVIFKANNRLIYYYIICASIFVFSLNYIDIEFIIGQFTRNTGHLELAGRDEIWNNALNHISNHLIEGNGSFRYRMPYHGVTAHCHNSFLQIIANNGVILGIFYLWIMMHRINKNNFVYVLPLLLSSLSQYYLFNGCSFQDIIYVMLLYKKNIIPNY